MAIKKRLPGVLRMQPEPIMYAAGYVMTLYCKYINPDHATVNGHQSFQGDDKADVIREAILAGWRIESKVTLATCPKCLKVIEKARIAR